jgi:hypothetical protein
VADATESDSRLSQNRQDLRQLRSAVQLGRFVLSVDGQRKIGFAERSAADEAAARLLSNFPNLTVVVNDEQEEIIRERAETPA